MGLFSIFGEYDRVLLEEYDLWFLAGSSEEQKIREVLETKKEKYIQPNINPRYNLVAGRSWDVDVYKRQEQSVGIIVGDF